MVVTTHWLRSGAGDGNRSLFEPMARQICTDVMFICLHHQKKKQQHTCIVSLCRRPNTCNANLLIHEIIDDHIR